MSDKGKEGLRIIPGIGPSLETDLIDLGIKSVDNLAGKAPQRLYDDLCILRGEHIDRCVLYVFREAIYFASGKTHDPEKLKWRNGKDQDA